MRELVRDTNIEFEMPDGRYFRLSDLTFALASIKKNYHGIDYKWIVEIKNYAKATDKSKRIQRVCEKIEEEMKLNRIKENKI